MKCVWRIGSAAAVAMMLGAVGGSVTAQGYPTKPVRIVAGAPGTSSDYLSRYVGQRLNERWGHPVIVDNRGGGAGTISPSLVAKATPDGYTLLMGEASSLSNAVHLQKTAYDPLVDFAAITLVAKAPQVIVVHPSVPVVTLQEFIGLAKTKPRALSYAAGGPSSVSSITSALLCLTTGMDMVQVSYKGVGAALLSVIAGETQLGIISATVAVPQVRAGKVKALAVTSRARSFALPDVPTAIEAGLAEFEATAWFGLLAPVHTPAAVLNTIHRDVVAILLRPETVQAFNARGVDASPGSAVEFAAFIRSEIRRSGSVITATGAKLY